ncbi:glycosyl transferase [Christiangramia fulva]|uniref:Glycosyl transferase n=1 Tax=Christiangramia fulva TaxID=2126553 RepID=A0A2R3Z0P0_9FLAO|nr:glycosyltransferase [Christiangramia fulva]AVR43816.1 glycosyl transferase [Christiangramia fulva]
MIFSIFSHADHFLKKGNLYSYGPYVKEMNLWIADIESVKVVAPRSSRDPSVIDEAYQHKNIQHVKIPSLHYKGNDFLKNIADSFKVIKACYREMKLADHIHIRCPGNVGMLAMVVSSLFPHKPKTVKYAGNWESKSEQPLSYRFQKWWLSNTFLSRNTKVLVYGNWENQSKNIIPFFTASFSESEKEQVSKNFKAPFRFLFCGSLSEGKQPVLAVKIVEELYQNGFDVELDIYGEGPEKENLEDYISKNELQQFIFLKGNQPQEVLKNAYKKAHFSILPSRSEGWPKALAEGMFFGCIPIGTEISCVPWMLGEGSRGILLPAPPGPSPSLPSPQGPQGPSPSLPSPLNSPKGGTETGSVLEVVDKIIELLQDEEEMNKMSKRAHEWSQEYTLEKFEAGIRGVLKN